MGAANLISIVIPVYNGEKFIGKAIESCFEQTEQNGWEIIVVDDGSTDGTASAVEPFLRDTRVKLFSQENKGLPAARNAGIVNSSGDHIAFLDADDFYLPHTMKFFQEASRSASDSVAMFYCDYLQVSSDGETTNAVKVKPPMKRPDLHLQFLLPKLYPILPSTTLVRKNVIDDVGLFDERFLRCQDLQFFTRISEKYDLGKLDFFSSGRRMHENQSTKDRQSIIFWREEFNLEYLRRHDFCYFCSTHDRVEQAKLAEHFGDLMMKAPEPMIRTATYLYQLSLAMKPSENVRSKLDRLQIKKQ